MSDPQLSHDDDSSWFDRFGKSHDKPSPHAHPAKGKGKGKGKNVSPENVSPADVKAASHKFWVQFAWGSVISAGLNFVLLMILVLWLAKSFGDMTVNTEANTIHLVKGLQSSSQAFQASQARARQYLIASQLAITRSQTQANLQQALAAKTQRALYQSQQITQRQAAALAQAEANLAEQQAKSASSQAAAMQP